MQQLQQFMSFHSHRGFAWNLFHKTSHHLPPDTFDALMQFQPRPASMSISIPWQVLTVSPSSAAVSASRGSKTQQFSSSSSRAAYRWVRLRSQIQDLRLGRSSLNRSLLAMPSMPSPLSGYHACLRCYPKAR